MIVNSDTEIIARIGVLTRWDSYSLSLRERVTVRTPRTRLDAAES